MTYRGYKETEDGVYAQITVARTYAARGGWQVALNLSGFNDRDQFLGFYEAGYMARDTTASLESYNIFAGRVVLAGDRHSAEAKSFDSLAVRSALAGIDYDRLASLAAEPTQIDDSFVVWTD